MGTMKYYTQIIHINNERYLIAFLYSYFEGFNTHDIKDIQILGNKLSIYSTNIIFDYFYRNGHIDYIYNRLYVLKSSENERLESISNNELSFRILKECNKWWLNNIDLLDPFIHERYIKKLFMLNDIKYKYDWFSK